MFNQLNEQSRNVMSHAADEARRFNHEYVGTEHILLGLLLKGSCDAGGTLQRLGLSADNVRSEIDKLVHRGPKPVTIAQLPLTPRAKRVIEFATEEASCLSQSQVAPEHLLIGLIRELGGVAGQVMTNLGLQLERVRAEALKIRMMQVRIVERAVRPLRAGTKHRRKMREELLAHLAEIYREEFASLNDPFAAMDAAAKRFGDPSELSRDLQSAVSGSERRSYLLERWLGWHAPESMLHMMMRTSFISFCIIAALVGVPILAGIVIQGWNPSQPVALRTLAAMAILTPLSQFGFGICYYKTRDALWGVFGSRRSRLSALVWCIAAAAVVFAAGISFILIVERAISDATNSLTMLSLIATLSGITCMMLARARGLTEIRDTIWATVDLQTTS